MLRLDSVTKQHGKQILYVDASMSVFPGERVALVGPNGAGKSTVFRLIVKEETPDAGNVVLDKGISVGYFSQDTGEMSGRTVLEETIAGAGEVAQVGAEVKRLELALADPDQADKLDEILTQFGEVQARFDELGGYALEAKAREILAGLSFRPSSVDEDVGKLSGGWKMRVALARILLMKPDLLLLDEPTNHLDLESIIWLERFLKDFAGALIITSHDREFINRLVTKVVEINGGEMTTFSGNFESYLAQRAVLDAQEEAQFNRQQAMLAKEEAFIARFKARASHAAQVQSRVKKLEKIERVAAPKRRTKLVKFEFPRPARSGDDVSKLTGVCKAYGSLSLYKDFNWLIRRGERWCVMGVNGAGKSTLLKLLANASQPDSGQVHLGAGVRIGYFAQHSMEVLNPDESVFETLHNSFPSASVGALKTLAGVFGFSGEEADKSCRVLSGGEKARLVLAKMLFDPPNLLILDEPTNHLDLDTKEMMVAALNDFEGTMVFVSHDRKFLGALSNRVLEVTPQKIREYRGGYSEYVTEVGSEAPGVG